LNVESALLDVVLYHSDFNWFDLPYRGN